MLLLYLALSRLGQSFLFVAFEMFKSFLIYIFMKNFVFVDCLSENFHSFFGNSEISHCLKFNFILLHNLNVSAITYSMFLIIFYYFQEFVGFDSYNASLQHLNLYILFLVKKMFRID